MNPQIKLFCLILDDIFELKRKPRVIGKNTLKWEKNGDAWGLYYDEQKKGKFNHRIEYYQRSTPERIFTTIAHEYVHCWQVENNLELSHSEQPEFLKWKKYFKKYFDIAIE